MEFVHIGFLLVCVAGHGAMFEPKPRNNIKTDVMKVVEPGKHHSTVLRDAYGCEGYACLFFNQGCAPSCQECSGSNDGDVTKPSCELPQGWEPWIKDNEVEKLTYVLPETQNWIYAPWRSPGESPVFDSCGITAGTSIDNTKAVGVSPPGFKNGYRGSSLPPTELTTWKIGDHVPVSFGIWANHGGGYQYRICPAGSTLDEDCFKKHVLEFAGKSQYYWGDGQESEMFEPYPVTARDGSVWRKNPVPAYACPSGGVEAYVKTLDECREAGPMFQPRVPGDAYWGFSDYDLSTGAKFASKNMPYVRDQVVVPNVTPGHYVLSWRWDCEQTPQVWNSCADVKISAPEQVVV